MGMKRHVVNVMRPTQTLNDRGQLQGKDDMVISQWPCNITTLSGSKAATERMIVPTATHKVEGWGNHHKPIKHKDYLTGGVLGERVLTIEHKQDKNQNEIALTLICVEQTFG